MKNFELLLGKYLNRVKFTLKGILQFWLMVLTIITVRAQESLETTVSMGVNRPYFIRSSSNDQVPHNDGLQSSIELAYQSKVIGLGIQAYYFHINDRSFVQTHRLAPHVSSAAKTDLIEANTNVVSLFLPVYINIYNKKTFRVSPSVGLGISRYSKSAFRWKIDQLRLNLNSPWVRRTNVMLAVKVGVDVTHKISERVAIRYGVQRGFHTNVLFESMDLFDCSAGVTYGWGSR